MGKSSYRLRAFVLPVSICFMRHQRLDVDVHMVALTAHKHKTDMFMDRRNRHSNRDQNKGPWESSEVTDSCHLSH